MSDIWRRRVELERAEREERQRLLEPLVARYGVLYRELVDECAQAGHEWAHGYWTVGGDEVLRCCRCAGKRRADA